MSVDTNRGEFLMHGQYQESLRAEQQMADTVAVGSDEEVRTLTDENALLKRSLGVLAKRIEELEAILTMRPRENSEAERLHRIAAVLKTFYYADHSLSSMQPIIGLCLELNPEIVEQQR